MVYAVISDTHANKEAFQVVLADIKEQGITEIYCIGDIIGYGSDPRYCTTEVKRNCSGRASKGNHELALQIALEGKQIPMHEGPAEAIEHAYKKLWASQTKFLINLPEEIQEGDRLFVHGNPAPELPNMRGHTPEMIAKRTAIAKINTYILWKDEYVGRRKVETLEGGLRQMSLQPHDEAKINAIFSVLRVKGVQICFTGHMHVAGCVEDLVEEDINHVPEIMLAHQPLLHRTPQEREAFTCDIKPGRLYLVLCGAVGQPRDRDNRACYVVVDDDKIMWRRIPYDYERTIRKIKNAGLSQQHAERLRYGKYPDEDLEELLRNLPE